MTITVDDIKRTIIDLAEEKPDFIYRPIKQFDEDNEPITTCSYVTGEDDVGCIVGQALMRLGVSLFTLLTQENKTASQAIRGIFPNQFSWEDLDWIDTVQSNQDNGFDWKNAVERANKNNDVTAGEDY